jgi:hypothetical protein
MKKQKEPEPISTREFVDFRHNEKLVMFATRIEKYDLKAIFLNTNEFDFEIINDEVGNSLLEIKERTNFKT